MGTGASMPAPKSDKQRENLYYLEAEINGWWAMCSSTTKDLEGLLMMICRYYKVDFPRFRVVRDKKIGDAGWHDPERDEIVLNRSQEGANAMVLCHEAAHYLVDCFYEGVDSHGPEFVAVYMHLLDRYQLLPHECFRLLARKHKVKIGRKYRPIAFK